MSISFNESDHPRADDGKFAAKEVPDSEASLGGKSSVESATDTIERRLLEQIRHFESVADIDEDECAWGVASETRDLVDSDVRSIVRMYPQLASVDGWEDDYAACRTGDRSAFADDRYDEAGLPTEFLRHVLKPYDPYVGNDRMVHVYPNNSYCPQVQEES